MNSLASIHSFSEISVAYSYLGHKFLSGDVEVAKYLYGHAWEESPPLIKTIRLLQYCLTASEIEKDTASIFCNEFLYYWGMICIGEESRLIFRDLGTAEICFRKIIKATPKASARLAFIELLRTTEPSKNETNVERLDILRQWAGQQDLFSMIALAKIIFHSFLTEGRPDNAEFSMRAWALLETPCQKGHPGAIRFRNEMLTQAGPDAALGMKLDASHINPQSLYDYHSKNHLQICK